MTKPAYRHRARLRANVRKGTAVIHCAGHRFVWDERMKTFSCCGIVLACTSEGHCKIFNAPGPICDYVYLGPEHAAEFVARSFPHIYRSSYMEKYMEKDRKGLLARLDSVKSELEFEGKQGSELWWDCLTLASLLRDPLVKVGDALAHNDCKRYKAIIAYEIEKTGFCGPTVLAFARKERA